MKHIIVVGFLLTPFGLISQELKLSSTVGYSITEADRVKKVALCNGIAAGAEFRFGWRWHIIVSAGGFRLRYDHSNTQGAAIFNTRYFFFLPVHLRKSHSLTAKTQLFLDMGIVPAYQFINKQEIRDIQSTQIVRKRNLGFNFAVSMASGLKTKISPGLFLEAGLQGQKDIFYSYPTTADKTKTNRVSLYIGFSQMLKK